jgi:hypothetical protein
MGGSAQALGLELIMMVAFTVMAVLGFARNLWWVVAALAAHGLQDGVHDRLIANAGVPAWWPAFCLAIDVAMAAWLAALLLRGQLRARRAGQNPA